jgi:hypothetical protein
MKVQGRKVINQTKKTVPCLVSLIKYIGNLGLRKPFLLFLFYVFVGDGGLFFKPNSLGLSSQVSHPLAVLYYCGICALDKRREAIFQDGETFVKKCQMSFACL